MGMYRHRMPDREIQMAKDWTQEKLIDTLEKECEQLRNWYAAKINQNAELHIQIERQVDEIERLRDVLKHYAGWEFNGIKFEPIDDNGELARSALQQKDTE